jgi:hypothetical protein
MVKINRDNQENEIKKIKTKRPDTRRGMRM